MVCIYCGSDTGVSNSRLQKKTNSVWRRRLCNECKAVFTTVESVDLPNSVSFNHPDKPLEPFSRDKLFISIFESCRHRKAPQEDASALTGTSLKLLDPYFSDSIVDRQQVIAVVFGVLSRFDKAAASYYQSFHK